MERGGEPQLGAGTAVLAVRLGGEMDVGVDEPGDDELPAAVDDLGARRR